MPSSTASASSSRLTTVLIRRPSHAPNPQVALPWAPIYVFHSCQHTIRDARPFWPQHLLSQSHGQQYLPSRPRLPVLNACPQCWSRPKHPDHRFCSVACDRSAARAAPEVKYLPPDHELSVKIATQFVRCWRSVPRPKVLAVYMITWTESYQRAFEQYRDAVEARGQFKCVGLSPGNEQKRFRSTRRACTLGEGGNPSPCHREVCWMCETIWCGFEPHLRRKRTIPLDGGGIRLGAGIYTSHTSSKADQYAENLHDPGSNVRAMLVCRVVIGKAYETRQEDQTMRGPPPGYDCVFGKPGRQSHFTEDECVVYNPDAIRAAYLLMYEKVGNA